MSLPTATGRNNLAKNIASQYNQRKELFPNADVEFMVDVYGQAYTQTMLEDILNRVKTLLGNSDMVRFMGE